MAKFKSFFDTYNYIKNLHSDWEERLLYLSAIDLFDGICNHPVQYRLRVDGNLKYGLITSSIYLLDDIACKEIPKNYMWECAVCGYFHSGDKPPEPLDIHKRHKERLAAILEAVMRQNAFNRRMDKRMKVVEKLKAMGFSDEEIREA